MMLLMANDALKEAIQLPVDDYYIESCFISCRISILKKLLIPYFCPGQWCVNNLSL